jgi:hypothetical protein
LKKGLAAGKSSRRPPRRSGLRVAALRLRGEGLIANVSLAEEEHLRMFFHAADWFLDNQVLVRQVSSFFLCCGVHWYRTVPRLFFCLFGSDMMVFFRSSAKDNNSFINLKKNGSLVENHLFSAVRT